VRGSGCSTAHQTERVCRRRAVAYYPPAPRVEFEEQFEWDSTLEVGTIRTNRTSPEVECVRKMWYDRIDHLRLWIPRSLPTDSVLILDGRIQSCSLTC